MKLRKTSIVELGLASWLAMGTVVTTACTAADTISSASHKTGTGGSVVGGTSGSAGTSGGTDTGGGGASTTGVGGTSAPNGGNANPATGGAGGDAAMMPPDASAAESGVDAADDTAPTITCANATMCIKAALIHRYSFDGTGTVASDTVGTAHGTVINGTLSGNGDVVLAGGAPAPYVDLPNGIVSKLTSATFEVWVTWTGGGSWERIFDFGSSTGAENTQGSAATTFYLTPQAGGPTVMLAGFKRADQTYDVETRAQSTTPLMTGAMVHVAVVVDPAHTLMTLYRNGMPDGSIILADPFSALSDVNNWLGHSQYGNDPAFTGTLHEFRIYNAALPPDVILASFTAGPTATF